MRELNAKPFKKAQVDSTGERNTLRKLSAGRDDTKWFHRPRVEFQLHGDRLLEQPRFVAQVLGNFSGWLSLSSELVRRLLPSEVWVTLPQFLSSGEFAPGVGEAPPNLGQLMLAHGLRGVAVANDICGLFRHCHNR